MQTMTHSRQLAINGGTPVATDPIQVVSVRLGDQEIQAATDVLRSGMLAQGKLVLEFESRFADLTGAKHAIATSNGTTALQLACRALMDEGESSLVPSWTFVATASMVRIRPGVPVFADVRQDTFNVDIEDAARRATESCSLMIPVHLYGLPADINGCEEFARHRGMRIIYDAAQSHLAMYHGRKLGAFGDAVTYSFYPTKNMTTGEGGMITTNDDSLADELRMMRDHGAKVRYLHESLGFNFRMTEMAAAIGLAQLERLADETAVRRDNAMQLLHALENVPGIVPPASPENVEHVYHQFTCRFKPDAFTCDRQSFLDALVAEGCRYALHYPRPVHRQPVFEHDPVVDCPTLPVSERLAEEIFCLPVHARLAQAQVTQVAEAVTKVAAAYAKD